MEPPPNFSTFLRTYATQVNEIVLSKLYFVRKSRKITLKLYVKFSISP